MGNSVDVCCTTRDKKKLLQQDNRPKPKRIVLNESGSDFFLDLSGEAQSEYNTDSKANPILISPIRNLPFEIKTSQVVQFLKNYSQYCNTQSEFMVDAFQVTFRETGLLDFIKNLIPDIITTGQQKILFISNEAIYLTDDKLEAATIRFPWYNLRQVVIDEYYKSIDLIVYKSVYKENYIKKDNEQLKAFLRIYSDEQSKIVELISQAYEYKYQKKIPVIVPQNSEEHNQLINFQDQNLKHSQQYQKIKESFKLQSKTKDQIYGIYKVRKYGKSGITQKRMLIITSNMLYNMADGAILAHSSIEISTITKFKLSYVCDGVGIFFQKKGDLYMTQSAEEIYMIIKALIARQELPQPQMFLIDKEDLEFPFKGITVKNPNQFEIKQELNNSNVTLISKLNKNNDSELSSTNKNSDESKRIKSTTSGSGKQSFQVYIDGGKQNFDLSNKVLSRKLSRINSLTKE